jgi:uncharacterized protein DUF3795
MNAKKNNIPAELAPCGVFCGACPSFEKSCKGCASQDTNQKRKSKWTCKIRNCCYLTKDIDFCFECNELPCKEFERKIFSSHPKDPRFQYRREVLNNLETLSKLGIKDYLKYQNKKWECPICKGRIHWYHYRCSQCNQEISKESKNIS